ncbi:hypothetical protein BJX64DRAFT_90828 [Aspergillus heterothallicus]
MSLIWSVSIRSTLIFHLQLAIYLLPVYNEAQYHMLSFLSFTFLPIVTTSANFSFLFVLPFISVVPVPILCIPPFYYHPQFLISFPGSFDDLVEMREMFVLWLPSVCFLYFRAQLRVVPPRDRHLHTFIVSLPDILSWRQCMLLDPESSELKPAVVFCHKCFRRRFSEIIHKLPSFAYSVLEA